MEREEREKVGANKYKIMKKSIGAVLILIVSLCLSQKASSQINCNGTMVNIHQDGPGVNPYVNVTGARIKTTDKTTPVRLYIRSTNIDFVSGTANVLYWVVDSNGYINNALLNGDVTLPMMSKSIDTASAFTFWYLVDSTIIDGLSKQPILTIEQ